MTVVHPKVNMETGKEIKSSIQTGVMLVSRTLSLKLIK